LHGPDWVVSKPLSQRDQEENLCVTCPLPVGVECVRYVALEPPPDPLIAADLTVVHEQVTSIGERVTVGPGHRPTSRGADVGEEKPCADLLAK
jgi:hypothetical protein